MFTDFNPDAKEVPLTELCDLLAGFDTSLTIDLGTTLLHVGTHVQQGRLILVSTICGRAARIAI
jgi:hypothetical protein